MGLLKIDDKIKIKNGGEATIIEEFGSGGQGTVYKVSYSRKEYALKYYHSNIFRGNAKYFYENLQNNIQKGAPTKSFLWPLAITEVNKEKHTFGYLMNIRKNGYYELTEFFVGTKQNKQVHFNSFVSMVNAAINIIQGFRELHNSGYSYQDINNGNFFINPNDGEVLICDNDNVAPFGRNLGILGKQRYMAPEVVLGKNDPDKLSDRFSLAVILFRLFFINHPLEGKYSTPPCMTKELEKKYYGTAPIFVYDPNNNSNRPVPGTDHNLKMLWSVFPEYIRDLFIKSFSEELMLKDRNKRLIEKDWIDALIKFKSSIIKCEKCGEETFVSNIGENKCIECGNSFSVNNQIILGNIKLPLYPGVKIMLWQIAWTNNDIYSEFGEVVRNKQEIDLIGIKNKSKNIWQVQINENELKALEPNKVVPIKKGFKIQFLSSNKEKSVIE